MCAKPVPPAYDSELWRRISSAATDADLGRHVRTYWPSLPQWRRFIPFLVILGILDAVAVAALRAGETGIAVLIGGFLSGGPTLVLLITMIKVAIRRRRYGGARLDLYELGLVRVRRADLRVARYDSTAALPRVSVTSPAREGGTPTYHLDLTDITGRRFEVSDAYSGPWATEVQQAITTLRFPRDLAAVHAGHRIDFGEIWVTETAIGDKKRSIPWAEVEPIATLPHELIEIRGGRKSLVASKLNLPNFELFRMLFEHLRRSHST
ncbi:DUF6585 family protein [Nocardia huaxiensis]|uniref:DUF6585 family protein n=1 Tax=Nocardia huaxiensis TaxID=2755382 RepID=UPI001E623EF5|nr:DUF6585 family protein [Nocardia huaxiensis]UFS97384.1 hypothetical protein LPY97_05570 [Nocardia huaxiensis]